MVAVLTTLTPVDKKYQQVAIKVPMVDCCIHGWRAPTTGHFYPDGVEQASE